MSDSTTPVNNAQALQLDVSNMYATQGYLTVFSDGTALLLRNQLIWTSSVDDEYYTVKKDDTLELIANEKYGEIIANAQRYWWVIADANNIDNALDINCLIGTDIIIPDILKVRLAVQS